MTELERRLRAASAEVRYPSTPDLASRPHAARRRPRLALALAALVVAVGVAFAVPPARSAILGWLGLEHASVRRLPALPPARALPLGRRVPLGSIGRPVPLPALLGGPEAVYVRDPGVVTLAYRRGRLLVVEVPAVEPVELVRKFVTRRASVRVVDVAGARGLWIAGDHVVGYIDARSRVRRDELRRAGPTLLWERGGLLLRVEGARSLTEALRVARSVR